MATNQLINLQNKGKSNLIKNKNINSANETPIDILCKSLQNIIMVVEPSRASLTFERME